MVGRISQDRETERPRLVVQPYIRILKHVLSIVSTLLFQADAKVSSTQHANAFNGLKGGRIMAKRVTPL